MAATTKSPALAKRTRYPGVQALSGGRYRIRIYAIDPRTGREKERDRIVEAVSAKAASEIRAQLRRELSSTSAPRRRVHLRDYASSWLASKHVELKPSTRHRYAGTLDDHVLPALGDFYIDAITLDDLVKWRDSMTGTPATINGRLRILTTLLREAVHDLKLHFDPTLRLRKIREPKSIDGADAASLTADELRAVLDEIRRSHARWYPLVCLLAYTGLRFGEASALLWTDVDFVAGVVHVRRSHWLQRVDTPKTPGSVRDVVLAQVVADTLLEHRRKLVSRQAKGLERGLVFPTRTGTMHTSGVLTKPMRAALLEVGITRPFACAHGFRHTWNNLARQVTSAEVVRALVGHSDAESTARYSHVGIDEKRRAVAQVVQLVAGGS